MPRLRENPAHATDNRIKGAGRLLISKIKGYSALYGLDYKDISATMRMCCKTFYQRIKKPEKTTIDELIRVGTRLKFTDEDYIEILKGTVK